MFESAFPLVMLSHRMFGLKNVMCILQRLVRRVGEDGFETLLRNRWLVL
jgi:hypothetical protein